MKQFTQVYKKFTLQIILVVVLTISIRPTVFKIRVGRSGFFFLIYKYAPSSKITQTFFSLLLQLINYLTCSTMFLVPNIDQMYKEMKKSRKQTRKQRRISGSIFFCHKNVRVGRSETHIFFLLA